MAECAQDPTVRDPWANEVALDFDAVPVALLVLEADPAAAEPAIRIAALNAAAVREIGLPESALLGRRVEEAMPSTFSTRAVDRIWSAMASGASIELRDRRSSRVPATRKVTSVRPVLDDKGACEYLVAVMTSTRPPEPVPVGERDLLESALEQLPTGVVFFSLDGRCLRANPALHQLGGYRPGELTACCWSELVHVDDLPGMQQQVELLNRGRIDRLDAKARLRCADGRSRWVETTCSLVRDPLGNPVVYVAQAVAADEHVAEDGDEWRRRVQQVLTDAAIELIAAPDVDIDDAVVRVLGQIGALAGFDRVRVFAGDGEDGAELTHEWRRAGASGPSVACRGIDRERFAWLIRRLRAGHAVVATNVQDLPPGAERDIQGLLASGVQAVMMVPSTGPFDRLVVLSASTTEPDALLPVELEGLLRLVGAVIFQALVRQGRLGLASPAG